LKVSALVKIAMQCFEIFGGGKCGPSDCAPVLMAARHRWVKQSTSSNWVRWQSRGWLGSLWASAWRRQLSVDSRPVGCRRRASGRCLRGTKKVSEKRGRLQAIDGNSVRVVFQIDDENFFHPS